jgi:hypothetical protein
MFEELIKKVRLVIREVIMHRQRFCMPQMPSSANTYFLEGTIT